MSLKVAIDNLKFDTRMIDINIKSRNLSVDELAQKLSKLTDVQSSSIPVDLDSNSDQDSLSDVE